MAIAGADTLPARILAIPLTLFLHPHGHLMLTTAHAGMMRIIMAIIMQGLTTAATGPMQHTPLLMVGHTILTAGMGLTFLTITGAHIFTITMYNSATEKIKLKK